MARFVKLFFTLILVGSTAVIFTTSPVFADEETSDTPTEDPSIIIEEPTTGGNEWDGVIEDPVNTPVKEPATTEPTTVVVTEVVTTVTPPATTTTATPRSTANQTVTKTNSSTETNITEKITEEPKETEEPNNPSDESATITKEQEEQATSNEELPVEIPETATPIFDGTTRKITLLALTSTAIVYFACIEFWGLKSLIKIKKNEKLLKSAKEKAAKEIKITRSSEGL